MSSELKSNLHQNKVNGVNGSGCSIYEFEGFRLDAEHLMLYRDGAEVPLTPKQADTLLALVEKSGEIVSKDELMSRLWGQTAVEESNLTQNIYVLRKVLGDTSDGKPTIETLRRRGYRFNGALTSNGSGIRPDQTAMTGLAAGSRGNWGIVLVGLLALCAVAVVIGYFAYSSATAASKTRSFAVLTPRPMDPSNRNDLYEVGIADALINRLNSVESFTARPLSSTRAYSDPSQDALAAGRELKVAYVLTPNYQLADGRIRITTQLYDVATGSVEETFGFERGVSGVFAIQDAFASDIGNRLMKRFGITASGHPRSRGTDNEEAYRLYQQAMNLIDVREAAGVVKALGYLEESVALDPNYAQAWAGLALVHRDLSNAEPGAHEHYKISMAAIDKALAIDPNNADAYSALCHAKYRYEYDPVGAEAACRRALEIDPVSPWALRHYSNFLFSRGRFDESIAQIRTAMEIQPMSYNNQQVYALALYYARKYEASEEQFKRLLELNPNRAFIHGWLSSVMEEQGRYDEAFAHLIRKLELEKADATTIERFKRVYAASGWQGVTLERTKTPEATKGGSQNPANAFNLACLYAKAGDKDKAFEYLEKAYEERSHRIAVLTVAPQLDSLRDDSRYADLLRRVEGK